MRLRRSTLDATCLLLAILPFSTAITLDCARARDNGRTFDLSALGGPKTVTMTEDVPPVDYRETAFTIDICKPLTKTGPKGESCPNGMNGMVDPGTGPAIDFMKLLPSIWKLLLGRAIC